MITDYIGYWPMDESSGNVSDFSGNGNTGTVTGTACVEGKIRNGRSFSGTDKIDFGAFDLIEGSSGLSICLWAYQTSHTDGVYVQKNSNNGFVFQAWSDSVIYFSVNGIGSRATTTAGDYPLNAWYHATATFDGNTLLIYVNGIQKGTSSKTTTIPSDAFNLVANFDGVVSYWNQKMDDLRIYNRALSPTEVNQVFTTGYKNKLNNTGIRPRPFAPGIAR